MLGRSEIRVVEGQRRLGATDDGARQSSRLAQQILGVEARRLQLGRGEAAAFLLGLHGRLREQPAAEHRAAEREVGRRAGSALCNGRSEEDTSELPSLMRNSTA